MKSTLLTLSLIFVSTILFSQTASFEWAISIEGQNSEGQKINIDSKGNVYTVGTFIDSVDFDPGPAKYYIRGTHNRNTFIAKYNPQGNFIWAKSYQSSRVFVTDVKLDYSDNIYIVGYFNGVFDFDPDTTVFNVTAIGNPETFISKLDSSGRFIWAESFQCKNSIQCKSIDFDISNNLYLTGNYAGKVDFDPDTNTTKFLTSTGNTDDIYMVKLDSLGKLVWVKSIGAAKSDNGYYICVDKNGNSYSVGIFGGTVDFDPGVSTHNITSQSNSDNYILKLDSVGGFVWVKVFNSATQGLIYYKAIDIDSSSNICISGSFYGKVEFNPASSSSSSKSNGDHDAFVTVFDSNGNFKWVKKWGGPLYEYATSIMDEAGNIYSYGRFQDKVDFDPGIGKASLTAIRNLDMYISKLNMNGKFEWVKRMDNPAFITNSYTYHIATDKYHNIYGIGFFSDTLDSNPDTGSYYLYSQGNYNNAFIQKFSQCFPTFSSMSATQCSSFTLYGKLYYTSGIYSDTIVNAAGCDSIVTLNLTINNTKFSFSDTSCNTYIYSGDTLTNSGIYYDTLVNSKGCDSIVVLNLIVKKSSFKTISTKSCDSYIFMGDTLTTSGTYYDTLINYVGCDSIVILKLTVNNSIINNIQRSSCYSYIFNFKVLTQSGIYIDTLKTKAGCDSIVILDLSIHHNTANTVYINSCKNYLYNGTLYTKSGVYYDSLLTFAGCDSIVTLVLYIRNVNTIVTQNGPALTATAFGVAYQWLDCNNGYTAIPNEINQTYTAKVNGDYAVAIAQNQCTDTSACYNVSNLGLTTATKDFNIFPNPTNGRVIIESSIYLLNAKVNVYNITGQLIYQRTWCGTSIIFDIAEYAKGMYYFEIIQGTQIMRRKVIKE